MTSYGFVGLFKLEFKIMDLLYRGSIHEVSYVFFGRCLCICASGYLRACMICLVWHGTVCYGVVGYGIVWYGMVW